MAHVAIMAAARIAMETVNTNSRGKLRGKIMMIEMSTFTAAVSLVLGLGSVLAIWYGYSIDSV